MRLQASIALNKKIIIKKRTGVRQVTHIGMYLCLNSLRNPRRIRLENSPSC